MLTLLDIINEIINVRDAIDQVEVKGRNNQAFLVYAYDHCNQLVSDLNDAAKEIQNESSANTDSGDAPEIILTEVGEEIGK